MKKFSGYKVKELREARGLTQMELSMALGYKSNCIADIEKDNAKPSVERLGILSDILEVSIDEFYSIA